MSSDDLKLVDQEFHDRFMKFVTKPTPPGEANAKASEKKAVEVSNMATELKEALDRQVLEPTHRKVLDHIKKQPTKSLKFPASDGRVLQMYLKYLELHGFPYTVMLYKRTRVEDRGGMINYHDDDGNWHGEDKNHYTITEYVLRFGETPP